MISQKVKTNENSWQAFIDLSNVGLEFSPFDEQALLLSETTTDLVVNCAQICLTIVECRIFNFDIQTKHCRLYEGDIDTTGSIITSVSSQSICGSFQMTMNDFVDYGRPCSMCDHNRYLICINSSCQCQSHTYFDGSICRSQKLNGARCGSDVECRNDINLTCLMNIECGYNHTLNYTSTTTATSSTSTRSSTSSSSTTSSTTSTSTSTSTTTSANWQFDGTFLDKFNNYNTTPTTNMSFISTGYVGQALIFSTNTNPMLIAPYIPLASTSFTIDIDCFGSTPLILNTWMHVAFVFDATTFTQKIYLNGILDNTCSPSLNLTITPTNVTIGYIPLLDSSTEAHFQGYMDQVTVSNRAKSSCEILDIATLVAYFTFDNGLFLIDSGPNSLSATTQSISSISSGRHNQAITFNGLNSSFFQISGFNALGTSNKPFSFSLWIRPILLRGVLLHLSIYNNGAGWCMPFLSFTSNGSLVAQIYNGSAVVSAIDPTFSISTSVWSHIVQTWSSTNGLRLYINNNLVKSNPVSTYTASGGSNFVTLANMLSNASTCLLGPGDSIPYQGDIDDFRAYSRELSSSDVCTLCSN
ncbi:unnamed protein product [Adineta steineri]|uniref:Apple domain-containing protein n=1 Tax=Adineta steineri TaxID=433720 RepID=A0A813RFU5_9BILA|nr:unnamed protein product [Adineta steineri]CAF4129055.1 unnamed protein product [Adineta steineri]